MTARVNKEIRSYKEGVFFGLSVRQLVCAIGAIAVAVGVYLGLERPLGRKLVSWLCIVCAAPVAAAGFFQYHGMTFEKCVAAWVKSEILFAGKRVYQSTNFYSMALQQEDSEGRKKRYALKRHQTKASH